MIQIVNGNLLDATQKIIAHQVNCFTMGSGVAKQLMDKWPQVSDCHRIMCNVYENNRKDLLGNCQFIGITPDKIVANLFGQYNYGTKRDTVYTDYEALSKAFELLSLKAKGMEASIAMPYGIGCGLAGGDWKIVEKMIDEIFNDCEVVLYKLK